MEDDEKEPFTAYDYWEEVYEDTMISETCRNS